MKKISKKTLKKAYVVNYLAMVISFVQWGILVVTGAIKYPRTFGTWKADYIPLREIDEAFANARDLVFILAIVFTVLMAVCYHQLLNRGCIRTKKERW